MHNNSIVAYVTISPSLGRNNNNTTREVEVEEEKKIAAHTFNSNNNNNNKPSTAKKKHAKAKGATFGILLFFFLLFTRQRTAVMVCCWCYFIPSDGYPCERWLWRNVTYLFYISHHNSNDIWASDFCTVSLFLAHHNDWSISQNWPLNTLKSPFWFILNRFFLFFVCV